jgi:hypothetical protein
MAHGEYDFVAKDQGLTPRKANGFELCARVGVYFDVDFETTMHYTIYPITFGIRKGQELSGNNINDNGISAIANIMKKMKKPAMMTMLWAPSSGQQLLFNDIKRKKMRFEFSFVRYGGSSQVNVKSLVTFDNVWLVNILSEGFGKSKTQRINARFSKIEIEQA